MLEGIRTRWESCVRWWSGLSWVGRRAWTIGLAVVIAWLVTAYFFAINYTDLTNEKFLIHVFAAWTGELLFFTFVGAIVTLIAIKDPAQEVFEDRVRILFGRKDIPEGVVNYNKKTFREIAAYAKSANRSILVESFGVAFDAYKAKITTTYIYRNLLPDIDFNQTTTLQVKPDEFGEGGPKELGRITSIRISGREIITKPEPIEKDGFTTETTLYIPQGEEATVTLEYTMWLKVGAAQTVRPRRFVDEFKMTILSQCDQTPRLEIDGDKRGVISLLYNDSFRLDPVQGVSPGEVAFSFKLLSPTSETPAPSPPDNPDQPIPEETR